jgi:hypothetical protein
MALPPAVRIIAGMACLHARNIVSTFTFITVRPIFLGLLDNGFLTADTHVIVHAIQSAPPRSGILNHCHALRRTGHVVRGSDSVATLGGYH